jgi:hypothetical protein
MLREISPGGQRRKFRQTGTGSHPSAERDEHSGLAGEVCILHGLPAATMHSAFPARARPGWFLRIIAQIAPRTDGMPQACHADRILWTPVKECLVSFGMAQVNGPIKLQTRKLSMPQKSKLRVVLQDRTSQLYLQAQDQWTPDFEEAANFLELRKAHEYAQDMCMTHPDLCLVMTFDGERKHVVEIYPREMPA